jgi:hypothetical protein
VRHAKPGDAWHSARMPRKLTLVAAACCAALAAAAVAAADTWQIHLTPAGQAAARAVVLKRADLGAATGWTGGATKPNLTSTPPCGTFHPKQSDLIVNGAAETTWHQSGLELDSESTVLKEPAMVRLDWQRTVLAPQVLPCLRVGFAKGLPAGQTLLSVKRMSLPHIATYTWGVRALIRVTSGSQSVDVFTDLIAMGKGRTELTLTTIAPLALDGNVRPAEVRLARLLAARIRT